MRTNSAAFALLLTCAGPAAAQTAASSPTPVHDLRPGTYRYSARIDVGARTVLATSEIVASDAGDTWVITQSTTGAGAQQIDRTAIAKNGLGLRSRALTQGQVSITVAVSDGVVSGRMSAGAQVADISARVDGVLFADGAAAALSLATLPLAEG